MVLKSSRRYKKGSIVVLILMTFSFQNCGKLGSEVEIGPTEAEVTQEGSVLDEVPKQSSACYTGSISDNSRFEFKLDIDEVVEGQIYAAYSAIHLETVPAQHISNTSTIIIIKGEVQDSKRVVWVFGSGYGDYGLEGYTDPTPKDGYSLTTADESAKDVLHVVESCFNESPSNVKLNFVTPHNHVDHANPAFLEALFDNGFSSTDLVSYFYYTDSPLNEEYSDDINAQTWPSYIQESMVNIGNNSLACNDEVMSFNTELGTWKLIFTPGHTVGTVSLVNDNINGKSMAFLGAKQFDCALNSYDLVYEPHGSLLPQ